nr:ribonuclease H-like domain-containing protein [Tanacetum cinerariifolium]
MNYQPISAGNRTSGITGSKIHSDAGQERKEKMSDQEYILLQVLNTSLDVHSSNEEVVSSPKDDAGKKSTVEPTCIEEGKIDDLVYGTFQRTSGKWNLSTPITVNAASSSFSHPAALDDFSKMPYLEDIGIFDDACDDRDEGAEADYNNLEIVIPVSPIPSIRIYKDHSKEQIIEEVNSAVQKRKIAKQNEVGLITFINKQRRTNLKNFQKCLFAWFLSQMEPKKSDYSWLMHPLWTSLCTKWMSKSSFLYGTIEDEVYVSQPSGFVDPEFPNRVYKIEKALYGLYQAPRAWYETLSNYLLENGFRRRTIDKTLFIKKIKNDILLVQVYVDDIIFGSTKRLDIMFVVCVCLRFQVQPEVSHMHVVKRIFRYLKGQPTLGLWYPKDLPLELIAYLDSDYAGASLDKKSTT